MAANPMPPQGGPPGQAGGASNAGDGPPVVNGLPLPRGLLALMEAGRWHDPIDPAGLDALFPERGEFCAYTIQGMTFETQALHRFTDAMWLGEPDPDHPPGDIDPRLAVLVADLGI